MPDDSDRVHAGDGSTQTSLSGPGSSWDPRRNVVAVWDAYQRQMKYGHPQAQGTPEDEKALYIQMIRMLDSLFTRHSVELFCLNPAGNGLVFLPTAPRNANTDVIIETNTPWMNLFMARKSRAETLLPMLFMVEARGVDVTSAASRLSPEDKLVLQDIYERITRYGTPWGRGTEKQERATYTQHVQNFLKARFEADSVEKYLQDPSRKDSLRPILLVQRGEEAALAALNDKPWFKMFKANRAFLLDYILRRQDPGQDISWEALADAQRVALFDAEWRRQTFGTMWARGTNKQEERHFQYMQDDLAVADRNRRIVLGALAEARRGVPRRDGPDIAGVRAWNPELADHLQKMLGLEVRNDDGTQPVKGEAPEMSRVLDEKKAAGDVVEEDPRPGEGGTHAQESSSAGEEEEPAGLSDTQV